MAIIYTIILGCVIIMLDDNFWICFVFENGKHKYLVAASELDDAWDRLASRQSCSIENCKKWYKYKGNINGNGGVWKL